MVDTVDKETRGKYMAAVRSRGNASTELKMVELLRRNRITGWRRHLTFPGKPDFVWRKERVAVFVDGCFWHGCPSCYETPKSNVAYWEEKIERNKARDQEVTSVLEDKGWNVIRVLECELSKEGDDCIEIIRNAVAQGAA